MFDHLQFFSYIAAGFFGLTGAALLILLIKHKNEGNHVLFYAAKNFILTSFLIGLLYFVDFYRTLVLDQYECFFLLRAVDVVLFIAQVYFWSKFVTEISSPNEKIADRLNKATLITILLLGVFSSFNYIFFIDDYYYVPFGAARTYVVIVQILLCIALSAITVIYAVKALQKVVERRDQLFIGLVSILITFNGLWNGITVIELFTGKNSLTLWSEVYHDPTSMMLTLSNFGTMIYVFKKDFSPIYLMSSDKKENIHLNQFIDDEVILNEISVRYKLTEREREIFLYAYNGYTNPDIAEALYISKYTVKNHMHSIFEKLDISSRSDIMHLMNLEKERSG